MPRTFLAALFLAAPPCLAAQKGAEPASVIVIVADGTGQHALHYALTAYRHKGSPKLPHIQAFLQNARAASIITHSDGMAVTDSAAAATAMSCGVKTVNRALGFDAKGERLVCIPDLVRKAGKALGLVTDTDSWEATPAAFSAYAKSRKDKEEIKRRQAEYQPEILMGKDLGPVELVAAARKSLDTLAKDPDGFFLLFETEKTDDAGHGNDLTAFLRALEELDLALGVLAEYQGKHPAVSLFFVSDHDTGGLSQTGTWSTDGHTLAPAFLYAVGPGSDKVTGLMDNTRIFSLLKSAL